MSTTLRVRACRADLVHAVALKHTDALASLADVRALPDFRMWRTDILELAICDLVTAGLLTQTPDGHLVVRQEATR
jgi:hypothetical protein